MPTVLAVGGASEHASIFVICFFLWPLVLSLHSSRYGVFVFFLTKKY